MGKTATIGKENIETDFSTEIIEIELPGGTRGLQGERGIQGETGETPQFHVGEVKDTDEAEVSITGTKKDPVLNMGLPRGKSGVWVGDEIPDDEQYNVWVIPDGTPGTIPTKTSELTNDSGFITSYDATWVLNEDGTIDDFNELYNILSSSSPITIYVTAYKDEYETINIKINSYFVDNLDNNKYISLYYEAGHLYVENDGTNLSYGKVYYNYEDKVNKVTSLNSNSTNIQYPSAKCVYDLVTTNYYDKPAVNDLISHVSASETLPVGSEIDFYGQIIPTGWQQVDDPNVYSTSEVKTNKVVIINNVKYPVYHKKIYHSIASGTSEGLIDISSLNVNSVEDLKVFWKLNNQQGTNFFTTHKTGSDGTINYMLSCCQFRDNNSKIKYEIGSSYRSYDIDLELTIEYTKTTDGGNS